ncbi:MAG: prephenate dehydrogenase [Spirochaetaceae bacterium]|nr:prephenate dehydrogenase [Spirochaetaceae bacterium]
MSESRWQDTGVTGEISWLNPHNLSYGFVGLGLMGGSFARAIREKVLGRPQSSGKIFACDINGASLTQSLSDGIIDGGFSLDEAPAMLAQCDVVFICLYPHATLQFMEKNRSYFKPNSIVTDISGVKAEIIRNLPKILRDDVDFISGHPMAGSEKEGYTHASSKIFAGRNYILMPLEQNKAEHLTFFKNLVTDLGFTRIIETDAQVHDHKIAFTSQLCHVIAAALVDSAEDTQITAFGGGSFEDLTRIAMINAPLWTELFSANKSELLGHIDSFQQSLEELRHHLETDNQQAMCQLLEGVRTKRIAMSRIEG